MDNHSTGAPFDHTLICSEAITVSKWIWLDLKITFSQQVLWIWVIKMIVRLNKTTLDGKLLRLWEVTKKPLIDLGPVNLGVDHLIVEDPLLPRGHDCLRVEQQTVQAWMECRSPFSRCLPLLLWVDFPALKMLLGATEDITWRMEMMNCLFILQCSGT